MPKTNDIQTKTRRAKGKDKKKNTFKKYGKNTQRGMRIKQAEMEKKALKRKAEGNHNLVNHRLKWSKTKGKHSGSVAKSTCKITCKNKKHGK